MPASGARTDIFLVEMARVLRFRPTETRTYIHPDTHEVTVVPPAHELPPVEMTVRPTQILFVERTTRTRLIVFRNEIAMRVGNWRRGYVRVYDNGSFVEMTDVEVRIGGVGNRTYTAESRQHPWFSFEITTDNVQNA